MSLSDYDLIGVNGKKNNRNFTDRIILKRNFSKYNKEIFLKYLNSLQWENASEENDANKPWNIFKHFLTEVINKHVPLLKKSLWA